jgi:hypothetical protein
VQNNYLLATEDDFAKAVGVAKVMVVTENDWVESFLENAGPSEKDL